MRLCALALIAACGGGASSAKTAAKPKQAAVDEKQAEKGAKDLVTEIYETLGRGNKDSLFSLLDDALIVVGPRRQDALTTRSDALVGLGSVIDPKAKKKLALRSGGVDVVASSGGRSAWAFDTVTAGGEPYSITAILINTDDIWQIDAASIAHMPNKSALKAELARDAIVPPGATAKAKQAPLAKAAVERFQKGLLDQASWGADLGSRSDALYVGPLAGELTRGKKDLKKLWKKRTDAKTREALSGEVLAGVTPDGQLAWVSAPVTRVAEEEEPLPLRSFAVFEKSSDGWKLIALHESLAIDEPGAGTSFKKIVPPAEKKPDVPKPEATDKTDKTDPPKKKKKKKKKPKPVEDEG